MKSFATKAALCLYLALCLAVQAAPTLAQPADTLSLESLLQQSVSTAAKYRQTVAEAPASVTIVTSEQIRRYGYTSIAEVLNSVPGFYVAHDYAQTYVGTRGFARMEDFNNRIQVLLNGHTLNERIYGAVFLDDGYPINLDAIERIEVVRGPGSALYGTGAMFAVVNIVTKEPRDFEGLRVRGKLGSQGRRLTDWTAGYTLGEDVRLFITGELYGSDGQDRYFPEFDAPETNHGRAEDLDWAEASTGYVQLGYRNWTLQGLAAFAELGIPTAEFGSRFNDEGARYDRDRVAIELSHERGFGLDKRLAVRTFFDRSVLALSHPFSVDQPDYGIEDERGVHTLRGRSHSFGAEAVFQWDLRADNRFVVGAQFIENHEVRMLSTFDLLGLDLELFDRSFPYRIVSFYAQDELQLRSNLSLTAGVRYDAFAGRHAATPRAALVYHHRWGGTLKALYGEAFREPSSPEQFYENPIQRATQNPDLRPERIRTAELIYEQTLMHSWTATASLYRYHVSGLISPVQLDSSDTALSQFRNADQVTAYGAEVQLGGQLGPGAEVSASYSYQQTRQTEPDVPMYNSPEHVLKARMAYTGLSFVDVAAHGTYESRRLAYKGGHTDGFALVHLHLSSKPILGHGEVGLRVSNFFDTRYALPAGRQHEQRYFTQDGRRVLVHLALTW